MCTMKTNYRKTKPDKVYGIIHKAVLPLFTKVCSFYCILSTELISGVHKCMTADPLQTKSQQSHQTTEQQRGSTKTPHNAIVSLIAMSTSSHFSGVKISKYSHSLAELPFCGPGDLMGEWTHLSDMINVISSSGVTPWKTLRPLPKGPPIERGPC